jgi:hypothetical protein
MKIFLASLITVAAVAIFASTAHADTGTSTHTGDVAGTCTLDVTDGALPTDQGLVTQLSTPTGDRGTISTVCNTTGSNIIVSLGVGSHPVQAGYYERFKLTNGNGAYLSTAAPYPSSGFTAVSYTKSDLSNGFSSTASTMKVSAQAGVPSGRYLAAGDYTVVLDVSVTP